MGLVLGSKPPRRLGLVGDKTLECKLNVYTQS